MSLQYLQMISIIKKLEPATSNHVRWCNLFSQLQGYYCIATW